MKYSVKTLKKLKEECTKTMIQLDELEKQICSERVSENDLSCIINAISLLADFRTMNENLIDSATVEF